MKMDDRYDNKEYDDWGSEFDDIGSNYGEDSIDGEDSTDGENYIDNRENRRNYKDNHSSHTKKQKMNFVDKYKEKLERDSKPINKFIKENVNEENVVATIFLVVFTIGVMVLIYYVLTGIGKLFS